VYAIAAPRVDPAVDPPWPDPDPEDRGYNDFAGGDDTAKSTA
jgi:hypothetical protein